MDTDVGTRLSCTKAPVELPDLLKLCRCIDQELGSIPQQTSFVPSLFDCSSWELTMSIKLPTWRSLCHVLGWWY